MNELLKYTKEQIEPKRYPNEMPSIDYPIWVHSINRDDWMRGWYTHENKSSWASLADWFIDIPGAPQELKPLKYPENKPDEDGEYIFHHIGLDKWYSGYWNGHYFQCGENTAKLARDVDYFIPYRLDKESEMENNDRVNLCGVVDPQVWVAEWMRITKEHPTIPSDGDTMLGWFANAIMAGYDHAKSEQDKENEMDVKVFMEWDNKTGNVQITKPVSIEKGDFMAVVRKYLDDFGYEVTRKKPEIAPCPNPECKCRQSVCVEDSTIDSFEGDYTYYYVLCDGCGYCSPEARTPEEAKRLHNLIAERKEKGYCKPGDPNYGLLCDEDGNALPSEDE